MQDLKKITNFDPSQAKTALQILEALQGSSFQGRALANCFRVWKKMKQDPKCLKGLALAGAMVPAGMDEILCQLIERGYVDFLVTTGANISHALVNAVCDQGHYLGSERANDQKLREEGINRIYDVFLPETNYGLAEDWMEGLFQQEFGQEQAPFGRTPSQILQITGLGLAKEKRRCFLSVAAESEVPIFCGALADSEFFLNIVKFIQRGSIPRLYLDEAGQIQDYARLIQSKNIRGLVTVGGGVPRNFAQQIFPFLDMTTDLNFKGFNYGVRLYGEGPQLGHLSGCTFKESVSWGKYAHDATEAECMCDATIALPLLTSALFQAEEA